MAGQPTPETDPEYLEHSKNFWDGFMKFSKVATAVVIAVLLLMALFLL